MKRTTPGYCIQEIIHVDNLKTSKATCDLTILSKKSPQLDMQEQYIEKISTCNIDLVMWNSAILNQGWTDHNTNKHENMIIRRVS
jgi:hypothetical protein